MSFRLKGDVVYCHVPFLNSALEDGIRGCFSKALVRALEISLLGSGRSWNWSHDPSSVRMFDLRRAKTSEEHRG